MNHILVRHFWETRVGKQLALKRALKKIDKKAMLIKLPHITLGSMNKFEMTSKERNSSKKIHLL